MVVDPGFAGVSPVGDGCAGCARLAGENRRLRARVSELEGKVEELRRVGKRQAAPFSRDESGEGSSGKPQTSGSGFVFLRLSSTISCSYRLLNWLDSDSVVACQPRLTWSALRASCRGCRRRGNFAWIPSARTLWCLVAGGLWRAMT